MSCRSHLMTFISAVSLIASAIFCLFAVSSPDYQTLNCLATIGLFAFSMILALVLNRENTARRERLRSEQQRADMLAMATSVAAAVKSPPPIQLGSTPDSVRAQMEAAKTLINARQYDAARNLLKTIDHPKAKEWLQKLEAK